MCRRLPLAAFLVSRLLNHSRFPDGRAHGFAAPLRVALGLRPKCPQGTRFPSRLWTLETLVRSGGGEARTHGASGGRGDASTAAEADACSGAFADWDKKHGPAVTAAGCGETRFLHPGCSIIRASPPVALMVSLPRFGSLWAFGPTAHRADASFRAFGHSKRSRAAGAGEARTHGASGGRGDAPTAAGAGACSGASADWDKEHGPAGTAAGCGETRFLRLSGARNARVACVRHKDGRCHSERSKGRDPLT